MPLMHATCDCFLSFIIRARVGVLYCESSRFLMAEYGVALYALFSSSIFFCVNFPTLSVVINMLSFVAFF